jgi:tetratricopeptide (TPR) repeat protein
LQHNPNDDDALARIAHAADETDRHHDALTIYQTVADTNPYSAKAWFYLGKMNANLGETVEAVSAYEYAIVINESFIDAYCALAETYIEEGLYEKAIEILQNAADESPEPNSEIQYLLGFGYENLSYFSKAKAYYTEAIKINTAYYQARFALGVLYANEGNWQSAARQFDNCVQLREFYAEYWFAAADAHAHLENIERANFYFKNGLKHTNETSFWLTYINFLLANNYAADALQLIEESDAICAPDSRFLYSKVAALLITKRRKAALQTLQFALATDYTQHTFLLDIFPELVKDYEILRLLKKQ